MDHVVLDDDVIAPVEPLKNALFCFRPQFDQVVTVAYVNLLPLDGLFQRANVTWSIENDRLGNREVHMAFVANATATEVVFGQAADFLRSTATLDGAGRMGE